MKKWMKTALCVLTAGVGMLGMTGCTTKDLDTIKFRYDENSEYVQYYVNSNGDWRNIITKDELMSYIGDDLKGEQGEAGIDGKQVEFQQNGTYIQWRYIGDTVWENLILIENLKGNDGNDGENGSKGDDGLSAYQIWLNNGNTGTEQDFLNWLKGEDGEDTSYSTYTVTYDYGSAEEYFEPAIKTENVESNVWLSNIPQIKEEKYKDSFLGWFVQGTNKKVELYDFVGGNVTLEARFDVKKGAPSGLYKDQKQAKTWATMIDDGDILMNSDSEIRKYVKAESGAKEIEISIDESITSISSSAFSQHKELTYVHIPESVTTIGSSAFYYCTSLKSCYIPASVTNIALDNFAIGHAVSLFRDCANLESIVVDPNNKVYDSRNNCNALIHTASNTLLSSCNNTVIPNTVEKLYMSSFRETNIQSIHIPASVTDIASDAFVSCYKLKYLSVDEDNEVYDSRNNCNAIIKTSDNSIILGCANTTIPATITKINPRAFMGNQLIETITITNNAIQIIGNDAFKDCINLKNIIVESDFVYNNLKIADYDNGLLDNAKTIQVLKTIVNNQENTNDYLNNTDNYTKSEMDEYYIFTKLEA